MTSHPSCRMTLQNLQRQKFFHPHFYRLLVRFRVWRRVNLKFSSSLFFIVRDSSTARASVEDFCEETGCAVARRSTLLWTPRLGSSGGDGGTRGISSASAVIIARQQKGHDALALLRKCWPPDVGGRSAAKFFLRLDSAPTGDARKRV